MKYQHTFIAFVFAVISAVSAFAQQNNDSVEIQGYQFASASKGMISSPTMSVVQDGGQFEKLNETLSLLNLAPGDFLDCRFKLPETAFDVKATIVYKGQNDGIKGRIRWNKTLLPEDQAVLLKVDESKLAAGTGLTQKIISLEKFQRENELRIFSLGESLQILNVKITYSYRMPSCTVGDVTVKLLSPDSDKDVLDSDLKIEWAGTGPCDKGWVTLKYKDGEEWKTVPGAASFDLGDEAWKEKSHGQFVWKNHGLKEFPELKIVYSEDESPKHREARLAAEAKAKEEAKERERQTKADQIADEAKELLEKEQYDDALAKIDEALAMYPDNEKYNQIMQDIEAGKNPFSPEGRKAGDRAVQIINGVEFAFRWCPAGTFMMGSPEWPNSEAGRDEDEAQHKATLSKGFWMMETEVTQKQWKTVMGNNPSTFKGDDLPVEQVSWDVCQDFCKKCTQLGLPVSLPTEAQWEYACRAGTTGAYAGNLDSMAWYTSNSKSNSHPVGKKIPNAWGLYDMHGNVWEWCGEMYNQYENAKYRSYSDVSKYVNRGGSWSTGSSGCRSAKRDKDSRAFQSSALGFRCVINLNYIDSLENIDKNKSKELNNTRSNEIGNGKNSGERRTINVNGVEFAFRWCPAGTFTMGSPKWESGRSNDETLHSVVLTKGFWIMETEVTQKQWKAVMGNNPSAFEGDDLPLENVSWIDCQDFCKKCAELGLSVSLPTEAQWEYACRAGSTGAYAGSLDELGWYFNNSNGKTHPVGTKKPNAWGLYDMHGNVFECCLDYKRDYPNGGSVTDPTGQLIGSRLVSRGGNWSSPDSGCRSANRLGIGSKEKGYYMGFRCVINPE